MHLGTKICATCKETKESCNFYIRKQTGNLEGDCKICYQIKKRLQRQEKVKNGEIKYIPKKKKCIDCENFCDARKTISRCYSCENKNRWNNYDKKQKLIERNKKMWQDQDFKEKMSQQMKKQRNSDEFNKKLLDSFHKKNRLTKLHKKINKFLDLEKYDFKSEQVVDRYFVDELNENKKLIIEINGNYVHANPKYYKQDDVIRLPGCSYTAIEKWESDKKKIENLTSLGYRVITIWEDDDLEEIKKELEKKDG